jgi:hypothetical protein
VIFRYFSCFFPLVSLFFGLGRGQAWHDRLGQAAAPQTAQEGITCNAIWTAH